MVRIFIIVALVVASLGAATAARGAALPRTIVVVTDGQPDGLGARLGVPALTAIGLTAELHRVDTGLPDLGDRSDVAGILIWLDEGRVADGPAFLAWVRRATSLNLPIALMGATPALEDRFGFFIALGILYSVEERPYSYDLKAIEKEHGLVEPGRGFGGVWPIADQIRPLEPPASEAALVLQRGADQFDRTAPLLFTPRAAYAAPGYATWRSVDARNAAWMIDPSSWFRRAFRLGIRPAPEAGRINARRIFAPAIAPADAAAARGVLRAASGLGGPQPLDVLRDPPDSARRVDACATKVRSRFFGNDVLLNASATDAFAPIVAMCADDPEAARAAVRDAYAIATTLPFLTADIRLDDVEAGFRSTQIEPEGPDGWRIKTRGALQTVRFDNPGVLRLDWTRSEGVLGAARIDDALLVSLDPDVDEPLVALTQSAFEPPPFAVLVESRWVVAGLARDADNVAARVQGYGPGDMVWQVEPHSDWDIRFQPDGATQMRWRAEVGEDGLIAISLPAGAEKGAAFAMERQDYAGAGP